MADAGVSFAGAEVTLWIDVPGQDAITHYHDGEEFLRLGDKARITKIGGKFG